jgi:Amt family ammonium transporter
MLTHTRRVGCARCSQVDDPLAASPMHGFCGAFGVIFVGLMAKEQYVRQVYPDRGLNDDDTYSSGYGLFYGGGGELLACQICGVLAIIAWVVGMLTPFFMGLRMAGILRVPVEEEDVGLDISHHGGDAYNIEVSSKQ